MSTLRPSDLRIDYSKSTEEVYTDLAIYIATSRRFIGALLGLNAGFGTRPLLNLPSWVPDWKTLTDGPAKHQILEQATLVDDGSKTKVTFQSKRLLLRGYMVRSTLSAEWFTIIPTTVNLQQADDYRIIACFGCGLPLILRGSWSLTGSTVNYSDAKVVGLITNWSCLGLAPDATSLSVATER